MYDKWQLNRNPFYTRAIERTSVKDFAGRMIEKKELTAYSKDEGVIIIIGESGVGSTSLANYCRFSNPLAFTVQHEFRMESISSGTELMTSLIYGLANEGKKNKFRSKIGKAVLKNFVPNHTDFTVSLKAMGMGVNVKEGKNMTANPTALMDMLRELVKSTLRSSKKDLLVFQLNNMNVNSPNSLDRIHTVLDQLRDVFQTPKTLWYLLGDQGLEKIVKKKIPRLNSIVKQWIYLDPITPEDFKKVYNKRIKNSGKKAVSPFTEKGVNQLCEAARGRIRLSLDIASSLIQKYADSIFPEIMDVDLINIEVQNKINSIFGKDHFSEKTKSVLDVITHHPGITASEISQKTGILGGNINKCVNPLIDAGLVEKEMDGRLSRHYPIGLAKLLT